jgi:transcription antitermination factor NusG
MMIAKAYPALMVKKRQRIDQKLANRLFQSRAQRITRSSMPLLPLERRLFPPDLFERAVDEHSPEHWWVLHTRPRAEKKIARVLLGRSIGFFLPLYERQWKQRQRQHRSYMPLFPGYVFLYGDQRARLSAQETNCLVGCLTVPDQRQLHADLARVHALTESGMPLAPEPRLEPGTRVTIGDGPLAGLEGKILRAGKRLSFIVEVEFIQRRVSVEIDGSMIQPLAAASA